MVKSVFAIPLHLSGFHHDKDVFFHGSGQIVSVKRICTYFTYRYVAIYVVNVDLIFVLTSTDFSHVEMCILESLHFISQFVNVLLYLVYWSTIQWYRPAMQIYSKEPRCTTFRTYSYTPSVSGYLSLTQSYTVFSIRADPSPVFFVIPILLVINQTRELSPFGKRSRKFLSFGLIYI